MKGKFQQLQTSRDLIFELNLNKHPKDCKNLSLVDAENIRISDNNGAISNIPVELRSNDLNSKLNALYNNYYITGCIDTINELVLFINSERKLYIHRYLPNKGTLSDNLITNNDSYYFENTYFYDFAGEYTYNRNNELIVTYCFSPQSSENTQYPLSVVNLGKWENNIVNLTDLNMDIDTFPLCPVLPKFYFQANLLDEGYSKKGWYDIFVRYKINNNDYTNWINTTNPIYVDETKDKVIFDYGEVSETATNIYNAYKINAKVSDEYDICQKTINIDFKGDDKYKKLQFGFIIRSKTYTECKITEDVEVKNNINNPTGIFSRYTINYKKLIDYDINNMIKIYNNYYNVKNIINFKNQLYISNYEEFNFNIDNLELTNNIVNDIVDSKLEDNDIQFIHSTYNSDYSSNGHSILPYTYYNFYLHVINKYGEISDGKFINRFHTSNYFGNQSLFIEINKEIQLNFPYYFISFEQLNESIVYSGIYNTKSNKFYSEELNYNDNITLNFDKIGYIPIDLKELKDPIREIINSKKFDIYELQNTHERINKTTVDLGNIIDKVYKIAGSIDDNNNYDNTHFLLKLDKDIVLEEDAEWCIAYLINTKEYITENKNKQLIKCTNIINKDFFNFGEINVYSYVGLHRSIAVNNEYRIDHKNRIKSETDIKTLISYFYYYAISNQINEYVQINNNPQHYATILNEVDYDNDDVEIYNSKIFLVQDCVDLFKNNTLNYIKNPLLTYLSREDTKYNKIKYDKTIRRSNYISDESLTIDWRKFETENYKLITENKGNIINLIHSGNLLLIHTEHSLFQINLDNTLITQNKNIQLHDVDVFNVEYKEIFTNKLSNGGLAHKDNAIYGKFGYIYYSKEDNAIYRYDGNNLVDISDGIKNILVYKDIQDKENIVKYLKLGFNNRTNEILFSLFGTMLIYNINSNSFTSINKNWSDDLAINDANIFYVNKFISTNNQLYIICNSDIITYNNVTRLNAQSKIKFKNAKLSILINENYNKIKVLEYIRFKTYKITAFNSNSVNFNLYLIKKPVTPSKLRIYNDMCDTGVIDIKADLKSDISYTDITKPTYDLGNFNMSYFRDQYQKCQIYGNYFIVEFQFDAIENILYEFESLDYAISEK